MKLENLKSHITLESLLRVFKEEEIFEYYLNIPVQFNKKYKNPLRPDSSAGCFFNKSPRGNIVFVDFANTERTHLNVVDIVKIMYNLEYLEALHKIRRDLGKNKNISFIPEFDPFSIKDKNTKYVPTPNADIKIALTKFIDRDYNYWQQFNITPDILNFYDVRRASKVWINGNLWYLYNKTDLCYRYKEKERFKIYRPLGKRANKFRSNLYGGILEGYNQLPEEGSMLIITKSLKDVMTLHSLGYNAVAVRSESTPISDNAYNLLKNRFDDIFLWFDPDSAGIYGSFKMSEKYDLPRFQHNIEYGKDPSDIVKNKGKEFLVELIKQQLEKLKI